MVILLYWHVGGLRVHALATLTSRGEETGQDGVVEVEGADKNWQTLLLAALLVRPQSKQRHSLLCSSIKRLS